MTEETTLAQIKMQPPLLTWAYSKTRSTLRSTRNHLPFSVWITPRQLASAHSRGSSAQALLCLLGGLPHLQQTKLCLGFTAKKEVQKQEKKLFSETQLGGSAPYQEDGWCIPDKQSCPNDESKPCTSVFSTMWRRFLSSTPLKHHRGLSTAIMILLETSGLTHGPHKWLTLLYFIHSTEQALQVALFWSSLNQGTGSAHKVEKACLAKLCICATEEWVCAPQDCGQVQLVM